MDVKTQRCLSLSRYERANSEWQLIMSLNSDIFVFKLCE